MIGNPQSGKRGACWDQQTLLITRVSPIFYLFWQLSAGIVGQDSNLAAEKTKAAWREDIAHMGPETWRFASCSGWKSYTNYLMLHEKGSKAEWWFNECWGFSSFLLWLWFLGLSPLLAFVSFQLLDLVALVAYFILTMLACRVFTVYYNAWIYCISYFTNHKWCYLTQFAEKGARKNTKSKHWC